MVTLLVILTFALFLLADFLVIKKQKKVHPAIASGEVFDKSTVTIPENYSVAQNHLWLHKNGEEVLLGIDEFLLKALGKVTLYPLHSEGANIGAGDPILRIQTKNNKTVLLHSPIAGTVLETHQDGIKVTDNPYESMHAIRILPAENFAGSPAVKNPGAAQKWLRKEFSKLKDFLSFSFVPHPELGITMMDGGNILEGVVSQLDKNELDRFESEFLRM